MQQHADINADTISNNPGYTPLFAAVLQGHKEIVQLLLIAGADATRVYRSPARDYPAATARAWCLRDGRPDIATCFMTSEEETRAKQLRVQNNVEGVDAALSKRTRVAHH